MTPDEFPNDEHKKILDLADQFDGWSKSSLIKSVSRWLTGYVMPWIIGIGIVCGILGFIVGFCLGLLL